MCFGSPGVGVTGELLDGGAGNWTQILSKSSSKFFESLSRLPTCLPVSFKSSLDYSIYIMQSKVCANGYAWFLKKWTEKSLGSICQQQSLPFYFWGICWNGSSFISDFESSFFSFNLAKGLWIFNTPDWFVVLFLHSVVFLCLFSNLYYFLLSTNWGLLFFSNLFPFCAVLTRGLLHVRQLLFHWATALALSSFLGLPFKLSEILSSIV